MRIKRNLLDVLLALKNSVCNIPRIKIDEDSRELVVELIQREINYEIKQEEIW